jgi:hypothetical protein
MRNVIGVFLCLLLAIPCGAKTIIVDAGGAVGYDNIQEAIDKAKDGDVIVVNSGIYKGKGNANIDFRGKAITVRSFDPDDWKVVAATVIDANGSGNVVTFESREDVNSVLKGFTITNGDRGIYCRRASPTIANCVITDNKKSSRGGGMYNNKKSSPAVTSCVFVGNTADVGGGMANWDGSSPTVINCVFYNNTADSDGGGMANEESSPTVINCTFFGNDANDNGGGIYNEDGSKAKLYNCIFWGNDASGEGGEIYNDGSKPTFSYCDIEGKLNGSKCGRDVSEDEGHNEDEDPKFVDKHDPNGDDNIWGTSDDGLIPTNEDIIDEGDDDIVKEKGITTDIKGDARRSGGTVDMGAYERKSVSRRPKRPKGRPRRPKRRPKR